MEYETSPLRQDSGFSITGGVTRRSRRRYTWTGVDVWKAGNDHEVAYGSRDNSNDGERGKRRSKEVHLSFIKINVFTGFNKRDRPNFICTFTLYTLFVIEKVCSDYNVTYDTLMF